MSYCEPHEKHNHHRQDPAAKCSPNVDMLTDAEDVVVRIEIARAIETFPVGEAAEGEAPADGGTPAAPGEGTAG